MPESLIHPLKKLSEAYDMLKIDAGFTEELGSLLKNYVGRPTQLYHAKKLTEACGGAQIFLKREDMLHGGAHKINNTMAQALVAKAMGKTRLIAETGAGQHGVATAMAGAYFGIETEVYMGAKDVERQQLNVYRMELLGARVIPVYGGTKTLKDAINEAFRDYAASFETTHYLVGSVVGPHPYPEMVRDFQSVIGHEARCQILEAQGRLPDSVVACVGGGSNALGIFEAFKDDRDVELIGVEAGGKGLGTDMHCASTIKGKKGVFHGMHTYILQDGVGQIAGTHSISAGLDYPGVGPEHAFFRDIGRVRYVSSTDKQTLLAFNELCRQEGILPALESSHALSYAMRSAAVMDEDDIVLVNLSGRGDKDLDIVRGVMQ